MNSYELCTTTQKAFTLKRVFAYHVCVYIKLYIYDVFIGQIYIIQTLESKTITLLTNFMQTLTTQQQAINMTATSQIQRGRPCDAKSTTLTIGEKLIYNQKLDETTAIMDDKLLERNSSLYAKLKSENGRQSIIRANSADRRSNAILHHSVATSVYVGLNANKECLKIIASKHATEQDPSKKLVFIIGKIILTELIL
uniref:Uncharacterized protein n=1 Tax=Glossina pallidipes TaxID=7398 RepID=A0A1A9Z2U7_GLOPL